MTNPMAVRDGNVEWRPYSVEFDTQEGPFTFTLYAVSWVHAMDRLEELKATAKIGGEIQSLKRA